MSLLAQVGMADQAGRAAGVLAYGDLKRLELAMALAGDPRAAADGRTHRRHGAGGARRADGAGPPAWRARGLAVLFTEHDMDMVFGVADRILVLDRGELIAEGDAAAIRADARVREVYLGLRRGGMMLR